MAGPDPLGPARYAITLEETRPEVSPGAGPLRHLPDPQELLEPGALAVSGLAWNSPGVLGEEPCPRGGLLANRIAKPYSGVAGMPRNGRLALVGITGSNPSGNGAGGWRASRRYPKTCRGQTCQRRATCGTPRRHLASRVFVRQLWVALAGIMPS